MAHGTLRRETRRRGRALPWLLVIGAATAAGRWAVAEDAGQPGPAVTLDVGVREGWLAVAGESPTGDLQVHLVLTNRSDEPRVVDVAGRHLVPRRGRRVQRLGLSHPVRTLVARADAAHGVVPVALGPHETRRILMKCCCLDEGLPGPTGTDLYKLSSDPTPETAETALRWWVDNPEAPRGFVNEAIWKANLALLEHAWGSEDRRLTPIHANAVRAVGKTLYLLEDRHLSSVDPFGKRRELADGVLQVFPGPFATYAVLRSGDGRMLARIAPDTGRAVESFPIRTTRLLDVWAVPRGPILWRTGGGVFLRDEEGGETHVLFAEGGRIAMAPVDLLAGRFALVEKPIDGSEKRSFTVYEVSARTGEVTRGKTFWNLSDMAVGSAGVFALSSGGSLLRLADGRLHSLLVLPEARRLVAVGRERIVFESARGIAVFDLRSNRTVPLVSTAQRVEGAPSVGEVTLDPVTDDVLWTEGTTLWQLSAHALRPDALLLRLARDTRSP